MRHTAYCLLPLLFYLLVGRALGQSADAALQHLTALSTDLEKVQYLEQRIDSLHRVQPAQALIYAQQADSLALLIDSLPLSLEIQRLRALPLRVMGSYDQAQTILQQIIEQLPAASPSSALLAVGARVRTNRAVLYRLQADMLTSVAESQRAIRQSDSLARRHPHVLRHQVDLSEAYNGLAITNARMSNYPQSNEYFRQALRIDRKLGNQAGADGRLFNIGSNFFKTEQYDSAEHYWLQVIQRTDTSQVNFMSDAIYKNLGALATQQGRWAKAQQYYQRALQLHRQSGNPEAMADLYQSLAFMYNKKGEYSRAQQEAQTGLLLVDQDLRVRVLLHQELAESYRGLRRYQPAATHFEQYATLQDSLLNQEKAEAIAEMAARFQHEQQEQELALRQQEIALLRQNNQISRLQRNIVALGLLLLAITGGLITLGQRRKIRAKQAQLQHARAFTATVRENAQLQAQQFRQELDHRNQQLTSYTLNFVQKNELMSDLRDKVELLQQQKQWSSRDFRQLKAHIQQHLSIDQDWEHFKLHFESVHPDFFRHLAAVCPELSPKERKLCALIRLNLDIKETAAILGISPDSVKTARHRLRKKLRMDFNDAILDVLMRVEQETPLPEASALLVSS